MCCSGSTVCPRCTQLRAQGARALAFCRRHIVSPPSLTVLAEPSTGSRCAELGQRPRRRGRHAMSPGAPGILFKLSSPLWDASPPALLPECPGKASVHRVDLALLQEPSGSSAFMAFIWRVSAFPTEMSETRDVTDFAPCHAPSSQIKKQQRCERGLYDETGQRVASRP